MIEKIVGIGRLYKEYVGKEVSIMVNQSVIDSSVNLEQLKDIEDLIPNIDKAISEKVETFLDKSGDQPYAHMNEGYVVVVEMTGEMDATDAISDYLRKRTELMY